MPPKKDTASDLRKDEDADTRDVDESAKADEEQEVEDADADTRDVIETTESDTADVSRKLDGVLESISALSQIVAQMSRDYGAGTANASGDVITQADVADGDVSLEDLDYSLD